MKCTFFNRKRGDITIVKQTNPAGAAQTFSFNASYDADGFSLSDGQSNWSGALVPGTYSVSEGGACRAGRSRARPATTAAP